MNRTIDNRDDFKEYCLRKLGKPVIEINVDDGQVDDRVDEALEWFRDRTYDGMEKSLYSHVFTAEDQRRGRQRRTESGRADIYVELDQSIQAVNFVYPIEDYQGVSSLFSLEYHILKGEILAFGNSPTFVPYTMLKRHIELINEVLVGDEFFRFNRHTNRLYLQSDPDQFRPGNHLLIDCMTVTDPDVYNDVWNDPWLKRYATALIKQQWGSNLSKFAGVNLPGGIQLDGPRILNEAVTEIADLEQKMMTDEQEPPDFFLALILGGCRGHSGHRPGSVWNRTLSTARVTTSEYHREVEARPFFFGLRLHVDVTTLEGLHPAQGVHVVLRVLQGRRTVVRPPREAQ